VTHVPEVPGRFVGEDEVTDRLTRLLRSRRVVVDRGEFDWPVIEPVTLEAERVLLIDGAVCIPWTRSQPCVVQRTWMFSTTVSC